MRKWTVVAFNLVTVQGQQQFKDQVFIKNIKANAEGSAIEEAKKIVTRENYNVVEVE